MKRALALVSLVLVIVAHPSLAQKITWQSYFTPDYAEVKDVTFGNDVYVAVGTDSNVLYSANGRQWSKGTLPEGFSCDLNTVEFAFNQFWAGGKNLLTNKFVILLSLDGVNWADVSNEYFQSSYNKPKEIKQFFNYRQSGSEILFMSSWDGTNTPEIQYSKEGSKFEGSYSLRGGDFYQASTELGWYNPLSWEKGWKIATNFNSNIYFESNYKIPADLTRIAYGNSFLVGVGPSRKIAYRQWPSGNFTYANSPAISNYTGVAFGDGSFAAVGTNGALVNSFDNGKSWTAVTNLNLGTIDFNGIKFVGGKFLAFGGGRIVCGQPATQRAWSEASLPSRSHPINSIATNGVIAVAVGAKGQILHSSNGKSWSKAAPITSSNLLSVDYDLRTKLFFASGARGTILTSANGVNWSLRKTDVTTDVFGVARAGSGLYAGGAPKSFLTSSNGTTWKNHSLTSLSASYRAVNLGIGAGLIENPSSKGQVWLHRGGKTRWTALKSPGATGFGDAQLFNGSLWLGGLNGKLYSSPQKTVGGSWKTTESRTRNPIYGLAADAGFLTAVGAEGLVYTLSKDNKWRIETIMEGAPTLCDAIDFKKMWVVAGRRGDLGFIATTPKN